MLNFGNIGASLFGAMGSGQGNLQGSQGGGKPRKIDQIASLAARGLNSKMDPRAALIEVADRLKNSSDVALKKMGEGAEKSLKLRNDDITRQVLTNIQNSLEARGASSTVGMEAARQPSLFGSDISF